MGRTIVYNDNVEDFLSKLSKSPPHCGLLIGSSTSVRDIVVHVAPTPKKEPLEEEENRKNVKEGEIDEAWICQHAKQVTRMLPGGVDVLGIYAYGPPEFLVKNGPNFRQILFALYNSISKDQRLGFCGRVKDRIQLQLCSVSKKATCKTFDVSDYKSGARPADWKPSPTPIQWNQIDTEYHLDQWIPIESKKSEQSLLKQIQTGLEPLYGSVATAIVLIDGKMRDGSELLSQPPSEGGGGKRKPKDNKNITTGKLQHSVEIFSLPENTSPVIDPELVNCGAVMEMKGSFHCRAFAPSKSTVEESILAIKQDIIRSIVSRCEIHCEDMLFINEEQQGAPTRTNLLILKHILTKTFLKDSSLVHELPRRVFTRLGNITVSDYDYGDATSLEAFKELLNLDLSEEDIDTSTESRCGKDFSEPDMEERLSEAGEQVIEAISSRRNVILPVVSATVLAAVAVTLGYFFAFE